ncbi:OmpA family protein [Polyangium sorediatum]|uniref:OmpA family protein n=1 Tax=Polyangium sorediatum TaxID=889274 RepID=A0ABT6NW62_9BACT|nr:OmpA family protein [Polyangium sorediatum]MDI1432541.1 OmpA family protein [Polyangium sorediatum]
MKRSISFLLSLATLAVAPVVAEAAEEGRFDAQTFRPSAAPRDLVMIQKSEVVSHLSPTFGIYTDIGLDPLAVAAITTGQQIRAVGARLQVTALAGIGFYDIFDITMAMPLVAWQMSDNLRPLGTEGEISPSALGDLRFNTKIAIPYLNRKAQIKEGFGMAVTGNLNLPTGDQNAFASDGAVSGGLGLVADYRFNFGLLVTANGGVWFRPDRQFAGTKVGDMANFGIGAEMYVVQRWGWSVLGGVYGSVSMVKFPDSPSQVPAEALMAMRWQWASGFSLTVGGTFGANCGFGAPVFRAFAGLTWQPSKSREQQEIDRLKQVDSEDPDHDGLIGDADHCPELPGVPQNMGCPDSDSDKDGVPDRDDKCPMLAGGRGGCPGAFVKGDEIKILDQVHFATDKDIILDDSKKVIEAVITVLRDNPEIRAVEIEGHTDVRAGDVYNHNLSQRRVESVRAYMIQRGIDPSRLTAKGYGHSKPIYDDSMCLGKDEELSEDCKFMTQTNRRVVFRIKGQGSAPGTAVGGGGTVLSPGDKTLDGEGVINGNGVLNGGSTLPSGGILPKGNGVLDTKDPTLPGSTLPRSGEQLQPEAPKEEGADKPADGKDKPADGKDKPGKPGAAPAPAAPKPGAAPAPAAPKPGAAPAKPPAPAKPTTPNPTAPR